jgi:hypothetical protein
MTNPTIEQLAAKVAEEMFPKLHGSDPQKTKELRAWAEKHLLSFLSAVHAGPLKGVEEALDVANKRATGHRLDDYYATGGQSDNDYEAQVKTAEALALLQSLRQQK